MNGTALADRPRVLELAEQCDDDDERAARLTFTVVGAGYTGTEVAAQGALLTQRALRRRPQLRGHQARWVLLDLASRVLPRLDAGLSGPAASVLHRRGVDIRLGQTVGEVSADHVIMSDGQARAYKHHDLGFVVDLGGWQAAANPLGVRVSGPVAKALTRGYHLYALPEAGFGSLRTGLTRRSPGRQWSSSGSLPNRAEAVTTASSPRPSPAPGASTQPGQGGRQMQAGMTPGHSQPARSAVFLHDPWLGPSSWETFAGYFANRGYQCLTPEWPVPQVSHAPGAARGGRGATPQIIAIVDSYDDMIQAMSSPPVIVGHGIGGLFTQLLLERGWQEIADYVSGWLTRHPVLQPA